MTEDANEGVFGPPPPTGNFIRASVAAGLGQLSYPTAPETRQGWDASDAAVKAIVEKDGLAQHLLWKGGGNGYSAHPLSTCRMGDDPATSSLDDQHELRGHPGLFVTDGSAVPTSLCVNPSLTIAALAESAPRRCSSGAAASSGSRCARGCRRPGAPTPYVAGAARIRLTGRLFEHARARGLCTRTHVVQIAARAGDPPLAGLLLFPAWHEADRRDHQALQAR